MKVTLECGSFVPASLSLHCTTHDSIGSGGSAYVGVALRELVEVKEPLGAVLPVVELPQNHPQLILRHTGQCKGTSTMSNGPIFPRHTLLWKRHVQERG